MFCIKCGSKLHGGAAFCGRCGCPVPEEMRTGGHDPERKTGPEQQEEQEIQIKPAGRMTPLEQTQQAQQTKPPEQAEPSENQKRQQPEQTRQENQKVDQTAGEEKSTGHSPRKGIFQDMVILTFAAAAVCGVLLAMGVDIFQYVPFFNRCTYASPEFPDNILVYTDEPVGEDEDGEYDGYGVEDEGMVYATFVTDTNELIHDAVRVSVARDGTFAYQTSESGDIHIEGEHSRTIPEDADSFILSGSGKKIVYSSGSSITVRNLTDEKSEWIPDAGYINAISYDGNTVSTESGYSRNGNEDFGSGKSVQAMSSDGKYVYYTRETGEETEFCVDVNGEERCILTSAECPYIAACSRDYGEILFSSGSDIYYFSAKDGPDAEAQYVDSAPDAEIFTVYGGAIRQQHRIKDNVYCMADGTDMYSYSIVKLDNDLTLSTLISGISYNYNIYRSSNGKRLWCVSDGVLAYCDLAGEGGNPEVSYSDIAVSEGEDGRTDVLAVSEDDSKAYAIDEDGVLWEFTPDTVENPVRVCQNAHQVYYGSDGEFYVIKDGNGMFCASSRGLCPISEDGGADYSVAGNVAVMFCTKKNQYFIEGNADEPESCRLWYKNADGQWSVLGNVYGDSIEPVYWGGVYDYYN